MAESQHRGTADNTSRKSSGLTRMSLVFITSLLVASMVYLLLSSTNLDGSIMTYIPRNHADPPRPAPYHELSRKGTISSVKSAKASEPKPAYPIIMRKNLLDKPWDQATFDDVDMEAYKNMAVYNDTADGPRDMGLTSKMTTARLISPKGRSVQVGDVLQYRIQSRDISGRNRIVGGDFWYATLSSPKNPAASTVGYITDYGNGTYDAFILAAWSGSATFSLVLVHPYEAIYYLRNFVWNREGRLFFIGHYIANGKKADGVCSVRRLGEWKGKCDYPSYQAGGSTVFVCDYQPGFPCKSLVSISIDKKLIDDSAAKMAKGFEYLFKSPYYLQTVPVPNATVSVQGSEFPHRDLPPCKADKPIPGIQGFWKDGKWTSLLCQFSDWTSKPLLTSCLRGKNVVLLGDSTSRQLYDALIKALDTKSKAVQVPMWKKITYDSLELTVYWQFHPYVIGSHTYTISQMKDEVDVLRSLNNSDCNYVVLIGMWAHFCQWSRDSYIERVRLIRMAVLDFKKRCPNAPVVIKGPHAREHRNLEEIINRSDYYIKQIEEINREAFEGTGAFFMPVWDINLAYPSANKVHMPYGAVAEELRIFMGYVCDTLSQEGK